jgi:signal transduction histidine kinase
MAEENLNSHFNWLVETYFSDPGRFLQLKPHDILIRQNYYNNRLYLVRYGEFQGYVQTETGLQKDTLRAGPDNFIGVHSFFSKSYKSMSTVEAITDCEVVFIDRNQQVVPTDFSNSLEQQFMPIVVADLMRRQNKMIEINQEREHALTKLIDTEKMASLGQLAAGIAHELNNAISVLARNTQWLVEKFNNQPKDQKSAAIFETGLIRGRVVSSREARQRSKELMEKYSMQRETAALLAETGLDDLLLKSYGKNLIDEAQAIHDTWELGATFNDMLIASEQSTHVVKSIRSLGAKQTTRQPGLNINESINNAFALLRSKLHSVQTHVDLKPLPDINANMGEFVQVWVNLINNACEAMCHLVNHQPILTVTSEHADNYLVVKVSDNGLGIPKKLQPTIFQPNVTTKVNGLSFGLGLGLTIVQRIINEYNGTIEVESSRSGTTFLVKIPVGGKDEKA